MKGFKALQQDMTSRYGDMTYKVGVEYTIEGEIIPCKRGYHFCKDLEDVWRYYSFNSRIFEIEATGKIIKEDNKYVTNKIKLVRELSKEDIKEYIERNIDYIMKNKRSRIRRTVAKQGYGLEKLIDDDDWHVRRTVAEQGYGLDKLVDDGHCYVRRAVKYQLKKIKEKKNDFDIIFYTTHCPKCAVLEKKLKEVDIKYEIETDKDKMLKLGIKEVPVLSVGGKLYNFKEAVDFLKFVEEVEEIKQEVIL